MRVTEAAPRYGAMLLVAIVMLGLAALVCAPVVLQLMLLAGAGR